MEGIESINRSSLPFLQTILKRLSARMCQISGTQTRKRERDKITVDDLQSKVAISVKAAYDLPQCLKTRL